MNKMIIVSLTLINYTRISLSGITKFVFTPDELYVLQLILGTNGSGKSSIMGELWPLPGEASDFGEGGRKELVIHYKAAEYTLISDFSGPKPQHQFLVDGFDMNDGGKIDMFRQLCFEHFGVNNEIRALALEKEALHEMSPSRRRYWMIKLADTDFTYAMGVYNKLKDAHRDASGAIRRLSKRHVDEMAKMVDGETMGAMKAERFEIKALLEEISNMRNATIARTGDVAQELMKTAGHVADICRQIDKFDPSELLASGAKNIDELDQRATYKSKIETAQRLSQHYFEEHAVAQKKYDMLIKAGTETVVELTDRRNAALGDIALSQAMLAMPKITFETDPVQMKQALESIRFELSQRLIALPSNDGVFSTEKKDRLEAENQHLGPSINRMEMQIARLEGDIEHKRSHVQQDSITCPKCQHSWSEKASEQDLVKAEAAVAEMKNQLVEMKEKKAANDKYLEEMGEYSQAYRSVVSLMRSTPILLPYFNEITQNSRLMLYPASIVQDLFTVESDLEHHVQIAEKTKTIAKIDEQIELKKNMTADTLEAVEATLNKLDLELGKQTSLIRDYQYKLNATTALVNQYNQIEALNEDLRQESKQLNFNFQTWLESRYQELLSDVVLSLHTSLARTEDAIHAATMQEGIVKEIEKQLEEAIMNERVAKAAHIALSPTQGAIAEGLHRFINVFVGKLNKIINSVWTYPLEILPMKMDEGSADLDYKFPVLVDRKGKPRKDVAEGSESMLNMFDFAFKFCALRQLGLDHLPLFFDEFEGPFDDVHRERAIYFIKKLIDEKTHGQIFMVSHYESNHGALSGMAQTCVLSKDNLLLPTNTVFNEHVYIS